MPKRFNRCVALALLALAGCTTNDSATNYLIPDATLNISKSLTVPVEGVVAGALIFVVVDPLAPNWRIEESRLAPGRFQLALMKKRFSTGGDGEAAQVFHRRAAQLARDNGAAGYRVVEFSEGVESQTLVARRVASGVVEILR